MKDPAFLFYSSDFLSETILMSDEEIGQYIKLLCLQHQKGHLKEKDILNICKTNNEEIFSKFKKDNEGNYYNERLDEEIIRRKKYSESRRENRKKKITHEKDINNICNSYEKHMETKTITKTINETENKKIDNRGMGEEEKKEENIKKEQEEKIHFAEFVTMTNVEYNKLVNTYSKEFADQCITVLDNYKGSNGKKYKSDYRAILNWVVDRVNQDKLKKQNNKGRIDDFRELWEEAQNE